MNKTKLNIRLIKHNAPVQLENVSSWTIENYSDSILYLVKDGARIPIPAIDANSIPGQWQDSGDFTYSDIDVEFQFANPVKTGEAFIYFKTKINC